MHRTCIFCYYDPNGNITDDIPFLLFEIKKVCESLIIVVNGKVLSLNVFQSVADKIILRENTGYDAAAYKTALEDLECKRIIEKSTELVFCNSSFWGPFISFESIFDSMDERNVDFWGMSLTNNGFYTYLQSYFLVYKKDIISNGILMRYFEKNIKIDYEYYDVCYYFERELFKELVSNGYRYDAYVKNNCNIYLDVDRSVCCDKLPILKKKIFSEKFYNKEKLLNALKYISMYYNYDIKIILESARFSNESELTIQTVKNYKLPCIKQEKRIETDKRTNDVLEFASRHSKLYIYGTGAYADSFTRIIDRNKIIGYIVSDDQKIENRIFENKPVYRLSELIYKKDIPIMVALGVKNTQQVMSNLTEFENVFYLWNLE